MEQSEIKLIRFDSTYFLPEAVPSTRINGTSVDNGCIISKAKDRMGIETFRRMFRDTNRDELMQVIKSSPTSCLICNMDLADMRDVLSHIFSQPHMDKYIKKQKLITSKDYAFWKRLLKLFPKDRTLVSKEQRLQELQLMSTTLGFHSQFSHWTVEVSSSIEHETALCHFVSACFHLSHRVIVTVNDNLEAEKVNGMLLKKFPGAKSTGGIKGKGDNQHYIYIQGPNGQGSQDASIVYLRPPGVNCTMSNDALCAITISSSHAKRSLMLINGSEEMEAFKAFEKKFMHSQETLLPLYDLAALRKLEDMAKVVSAKKTASFLSTIAPLPDLKTTVPPVEVPVTPPTITPASVTVTPPPEATSKSHSAVEENTVDVSTTTTPVHESVTTIPQAESIITPTTVSSFPEQLDIPPKNTVPQEPMIEPETPSIPPPPSTVPSSIPSARVPSCTHLGNIISGWEAEINASKTRIEELREKVADLDRNLSKTAVVGPLAMMIVKDIEWTKKKMEDEIEEMEKSLKESFTRMEELKKRVERRETCDVPAETTTRGEGVVMEEESPSKEEEMKTNTDLIEELIKEIMDDDEDCELEEVQTTVSTLSAGITVVTPTSISSLSEESDVDVITADEAPSILPIKVDKSPRRPAVRRRMRRGEVKKWIPNQEENIENIPTINEEEVKEWPDIFTPFDEETRKTVEVLIRMLSE